MTVVLPCNSRRTTSNERVTGRKKHGFPVKSLETKCFIFFTFYNLLWFLKLLKLYVFNAISSEKRCLSSHSFAVLTVNIEAGQFSTLAEF